MLSTYTTKYEHRVLLTRHIMTMRQTICQLENEHSFFITFSILTGGVLKLKPQLKKKVDYLSKLYIDLPNSYFMLLFYTFLGLNCQ